MTDTIRSVKITRRRNKAKRVAVTFEMSATDWAWIEELEDRQMIPVQDILYCAFFQGLERQGWENPDWVTTPQNPPSRRKHCVEEQADTSNVVQLYPNNHISSHYADLDDNVPF
ncbi:hypothetical protein LPB140_10465 [Sphingorhabdus lutea]|uniref:Uncharacterized protein n=1 Tax=Sphingorhabdus lutea TaxID=1913578 RepID=A0A1L3JDD8_9SPHN|nr:hypothetical protein [Sphingorhabdus lutea]APG63140.1 hypothetical protein LPB140_10465 [Sphingorhabdus lutea]